MMYYYQSPYLKDRGLHPHRSGQQQSSGGKRYNSQEGLYTTPPTASASRYTRAASLDTPTSSSYLASPPHHNSSQHNHYGHHTSRQAGGARGSHPTNSSTKTGHQPQQGESIQGMLNNFSKALGKSQLKYDIIIHFLPIFLYLISVIIVGALTYLPVVFVRSAKPVIVHISWYGILLLAHL